MVERSGFSGRWLGGSDGVRLARTWRSLLQLWLAETVEQGGRGLVLVDYGCPGPALAGMGLLGLADAR